MRLFTPYSSSLRQFITFSLVCLLDGTKLVGFRIMPGLQGSILARTGHQTIRLSRVRQKSMLTSSRIAILTLAGLVAGFSASWRPGLPALAFDGSDSGAKDKTPLQIFKNPQAALRAGLEGFRAGDSNSAVEALKYAAAGGESLAQWKLGKMYASGDGVPHDDVKAYDYFLQIVDSYDEDNPNRREISVVSSAFVAVGVYSLSGIANTKVRSDPARALEMFQYAATNFGDPNAQYN